MNLSACSSHHFHVSGMTPAQITAMMDGCKERNLPVELFGDPSNARYFKNWYVQQNAFRALCKSQATHTQSFRRKFAPATCPLPQTEAVIKSTIDIRMPLMWEVTKPLNMNQCKLIH